MNNKRVAVVGAGITGLTAAIKAQNSGKFVDLFERKGEPGGAIKTVKNGDWQLEYGPNTIQLKHRKVLEFINELGLNGEVQTANENSKSRFIVKNGHLEALPNSIIKALKTPLFSWKGKLRIAGEPFVSRSKDRDQSVANFVTRRLGKEVLDYSINPFVAGIFANNPEELSLRHAFPLLDHFEQEYGSLIVGMLARVFQKKDSNRISPQLISFKQGLQQLPAAIVSKLNSCYFNHEVHSVRKEDDGWYILCQLGTFGPYSDVVINIPAYKWTDDLLPVRNKYIQIVHQVEYSPLSVMMLGYRRDDVEHELDGFGFLVPEAEKRNILGALFSSTLFPNQAPKNHHLLTVFIGGGRQPGLADTESQKLLQIVHDELKDLIGVKNDPVFKDHIFWPKSIPKYHIGYDEVLNTLQTIENEYTGLHIAGNFRNGISVPDCILNGIELGERI